MKFDLGGKLYEFDGATLSIGEARAVKRNTGLGVLEFERGIKTLDPDAVAALIWVTLRRAGEEAEWDAVDQYDIGEFGASISEHLVADARAAMERSAAEHGPVPEVDPGPGEGAGEDVEHAAPDTSAAEGGDSPAGGASVAA